MILSAVLLPNLTFSDIIKLRSSFGIFDKSVEKDISIQVVILACKSFPFHNNSILCTKTEKGKGELFTIMHIDSRGRNAFLYGCYTCLHLFHHSLSHRHSFYCLFLSACTGSPSIKTAQLGADEARCY